MQAKQNMFKKAVKSESRLRLAIAGPSGSGKTFTSLALATALGGPVAVIDTEHGSAAKYADIFEFDTLEMEPPYHPRRFIDALHAAAGSGYKVIVVDSLTHAWNGTGGILDIVDEVTKRTKNSYAAWKEGTPLHQELVNAILQSPVHVIATMRSKQEYTMAPGKDGRQQVQKVGMAPVQRDGIEYEFDVMLDMDVSNNAIVSKTRCPALTDRVFTKPGKDMADILLTWLQGAPVKATPPTPTPAPSSNGANGARPTGARPAMHAGNGLAHDARPAAAAVAEMPPVEVDGDELFSNPRHEQEPFLFWKTPDDARTWAATQGVDDDTVKKLFVDAVNQHGGRLQKHNLVHVFATYFEFIGGVLHGQAQPHDLTNDVNFYEPTTVWHVLTNPPKGDKRQLKSPSVSDTVDFLREQESRSEHPLSSEQYKKIAKSLHTLGCTDQEVEYVLAYIFGKRNVGDAAYIIQEWFEDENFADTISDIQQIVTYVKHLVSDYVK